jgi:surface protein
MFGMFTNAIAFNQNLNSWDVSSVTTMTAMFGGASSFDGNISSWNVSSVTSMSGMFNLATSFNQPLNSWNVSNVQYMNSMFNQASVFNQPLNSWDVGSVTNMSSMFRGAQLFNQNVGSWNVSNVISMSLMFQGTPSINVFNNGGSPSISAWTINTLTNVSMFWMFRLTPFNQPIGSWNVSKVTNMESMFHTNFAFNQNIGGWNVSGVTTFTNFMADKTFSDYSTTNLDAIYNGWSSLPSVQSGRNITFNTIKYTAAGSAGKAILQGTYGWTITDGGI